MFVSRELSSSSEHFGTHSMQHSVIVSFLKRQLPMFPAVRGTIEFARHVPSSCELFTLRNEFRRVIERSTGTEPKETSTARNARERRAAREVCTLASELSRSNESTYNAACVGFLVSTNTDAR